MTTPVCDPIGLEVRWDRLAAATDETASTMLRTAPSTIIRESNDYTVVFMGRQDRTMAESRAGSPQGWATEADGVAGVVGAASKSPSPPRASSITRASAAAESPALNARTSARWLP